MQLLSRFILSGSTPWTIYVFNHSLPCKWPGTHLHTNGSLHWKHHSFREFKMASLTSRNHCTLTFMVVKLDLLCKSKFRYLDTAGQKGSSLYVLNGVGLFLGWLVLSLIPKISQFILVIYVNFMHVLMSDSTFTQ